MKVEDVLIAAWKLLLTADHTCPLVDGPSSGEPQTGELADLLNVAWKLLLTADHTWPLVDGPTSG